MPTSFGKWLRSERQARGLTMAAVEEKSGIFYTHISKMESGRSRPSRDAAIKIAEAIGANPHDALIAACFLPYDKPHLSDPRTQHIAERYYNLPAPMQEMVEQAICSAEQAVRQAEHARLPVSEPS